MLLAAPHAWSDAQRRHYQHMKGFLNFTPDHHQPQQIFIDWLLCAGNLARCRRRKPGEKFPPRIWKGGKSSAIKASDPPPNCAGHRTKANGVALIKKDALGRPYFQVVPHAIFFFRMQENDTSPVLQLHGNLVAVGRKPCSEYVCLFNILLVLFLIEGLMQSKVAMSFLYS